MKVDNISRALEFLYITFFRRSTVVGAILLLLTLASSSQTSWIEYKNSRFGYSVSLPAGLLVANRASDSSGVTWQTGTVRVQVSGVNNPYKIKPHEYFSGINRTAGDRIVAESHGENWYEILYTKDSRRIHRKVFIGAGSINSIEYSYGYRYREVKEVLAQETLATFKPGDLSAKH